MASAPDKALVLVVTKRMLYGEEPPLVGVGLVYKPHYISMEQFSMAYMHLHVWHAASSSADSEDKLSASCLIFMSISEMSNMIPVMMQHPVLLDVVIKEITMKTDEPMALFTSEASGSIPSGPNSLMGTLFIRSHSPISKVRAPHPCWNVSQKSFCGA